jgi:hypothetical protein
VARLGALAYGLLVVSGSAVSGETCEDALAGCQDTCALEHGSIRVEETTAAQQCLRRCAAQASACLERRAGGPLDGGAPAKVGPGAGASTRKTSRRPPRRLRRAPPAEEEELAPLPELTRDRSSPSPEVRLESTAGARPGPQRPSDPRREAP